MSDAKRGGPEPVVPLKGEDAFWLTDLYPDAKALFEHEQVSLEEASADCVVVLDANVLLLPFEFTTASVDEVEKVYTGLAKASRLVVPAQSAREFYKHRSRKLAAIADAIDAAILKAQKQIFDKSIPLLENDTDYLEARELGKDIINKGKEIAEKLKAVNERLQDELGVDPVSAFYRKVLGSCVVELQIAEEDRSKVVAEVSRRARLQIAPGYKDQNKEDGGLGDYLVWRTVLEEGQKRQTHCILVTEEEKPDWWIRRHGTFQPRPELIDEYRQASRGKSIHLLPLSALLAVFKAADTTVSEVQRLEERQKENVGRVNRSKNELDDKDRKLELTTAYFEQDRLSQHIDELGALVNELTADFALAPSKSEQEAIWGRLQFAQMDRLRALTELRALVERYPAVTSHPRAVHLLNPSN
ncbi:PIN-like domain-containing protein [Sphingobium yanoikuyae]